ncbi:MAG: LptF/LptG family permease [Planctomycetota bacterium]
MVQARRNKVFLDGTRPEMIRILQRYIALELIRIFILAAGTLTAIFFLVESVVFWQRFGLSVAQLVVTMPFIIPTVLNYSLPMATLVTCTFAYGRLSADNEILAVQAAGVHLFPIAAPAFVLGLALCPLTLLLCFDFIPRNTQEAFVRARQNVDAIVKLLKIEKKVILENQDGSIFIIKVGKAVSNRFLDVDMIQDFTSSTDRSRPALSLHAREGFISPSRSPNRFIFDLYDVSAYVKDPAGDVVNVANSSKYTEEVSVEGYRRKLRPDWMTQEQLWAALPSAARPLGIWTEIHGRWALSFTCLAFSMLGVPLGVFSRKGNFLGAFATACVPVFLLYYPMVLVGKSMAESGALPVALAMWSPDVFLAALGVVLLWILFRR